MISKLSAHVKPAVSRENCCSIWAIAYTSESFTVLPIIYLTNRYKSFQCEPSVGWVSAVAYIWFECNSFPPLECDQRFSASRVCWHLTAGLGTWEKGIDKRSISARLCHSSFPKLHSASFYNCSAATKLGHCQIPQMPLLTTQCICITLELEFNRQV